MFEVDLQKYQPLPRPNNAILCAVRKRLIHKTPEEIVRQSVINYLVTEKGYPIGNIDVEVPLSRKVKNMKGRADIVIYDDNKNELCLIECKVPSDSLTDKTIDQLLKYDKVFLSQSICIVIGNVFYFFECVDDSGNPSCLTEFPHFKAYFEEGEIEYFLPDTTKFEKYECNEENVKLFIQYGIFGDKTPSLYFHFLVNLYNFYIDESDKIELVGYEDIGVKNNKYGNAGGGSFVGEYRSILEEKSQATVSFSISSMTSGELKPVHTSLLFAVDIKGYFHILLELRVDKHIEITENTVMITHDGTITVGKLGSAKKRDLINFVKTKSPELVSGERVFLGAFNLDREITSSQQSTQEFIKNSISYALLRDEFRAFKKS